MTSWEAGPSVPGGVERRTADSRPAMTTSTPLPPLGAALIARRKAAGLSQEKLAAAAGCSTTTIQRLEQPFRSSADLLARIEAALVAAEPGTP